MQAAPGDCLCPSSYTCLASPGPSCAHLHLPDSSGGWVHRLEDPVGPSSLRGESHLPTLPRAPHSHPTQSCPGQGPEGILELTEDAVRVTHLRPPGPGGHWAMTAGRGMSCESHSTCRSPRGLGSQLSWRILPGTMGLGTLLSDAGGDQLPPPCTGGKCPSSLTGTPG